MKITNKNPEETMWFMPMADFYEDNDNFYINIDMPGVCEENANIDIRSEEITVSGSISEQPENDEKIIYSEVIKGGFFRRFPIVRGIDRKSIKAKIKNGLLSIIMPKDEAYKPRQIKVEAG